MSFLRGSLALTFAPSGAAAAPDNVAVVAVGQDAAIAADAVAAPAGAAPLTVGGAALAGAAPVTAGGTAEFNLGNILKLVPAEVVAPFIIGYDKLKDNARSVVIWFFICLVVGMVLRAQASRPKQSNAPVWRQVRWSVVLVSGFAFLLWAHAVTAHPPLLSWLDQTMAGLAALLFGAAAPKLVPASAVQD